MSNTRSRTTPDTLPPDSQGPSSHNRTSRRLTSSISPSSSARVISPSISSVSESTSWSLVGGAPPTRDQDVDSETEEIDGLITRADELGDIEEVNRLEVRLWLDGPCESG